METGNNQHILIVNEKPIEVAFLQKNLQLTENCTVFTAINGQTALEMASKRGFSVIVAELMLSDITGSDLLNVIKTISAETQLILISEKGTFDLAVEAMRMGAFDFVTRPFSALHLLQIVNRAKNYYDSLIENRRLQEEIKSLSIQKASDGQTVNTSISLKEAERDLILKTLHECRGNKHLAAKVLKIPRSSLYSKIQKHGIMIEEKKIFYPKDKCENSALVQDIPA